MAFEENENIEQNGRLIELGDSDYEIVDGEPDIEGWDVKDDQGTVIGEVVDLLFDPESRKVRYMIVELSDEDVEEDDVVDTDDDYETDETNELEAEEEEIDEDEDRTVLIPIGLAELVPEDEDVILPGITIAQLNALPLYEKDTLTPATEAYIRNIFEDPAASAAVVEIPHNRDEFYNHNHFDVDKFYNREALVQNDIEPVNNSNVIANEEQNVIAENNWLNGEEPKHTNTEYIDPEKKDYKNDSL